MTSDPIESGKRFADDLRRIRESRGLERSDVIAALRLDPTILDEFECTGLVGHPKYNRVYLRSFAGEYAKVVGIDPRAVSASLELVFEGCYRGALGVTHLGDPEAESMEDGTGTVPIPPKPMRDSASKQVPTVPVLPVPVPRVPTAWTQRQITFGRPGIWAGLAVALVVLMAAGWWWLRPGSVDPIPPPALVAQVATPAPVSRPRIVVGDTMRLHVVALDTLNPIRVIVDRKLRAPYWVLPGDSLPFEVTDRIVLERRAAKLTVSFGGQRLPRTGVDSLGTLILTRSRVQELLDSLRTAG